MVGPDSSWGFPVPKANASAAFSRSYRRHSKICVGWTEYRAASSGTVNSSRMADSATSGLFSDSSDYSHGFLLNGTQYTTVDYPGSPDTFMWGLNDRGQVVVDTDDGCGFIYNVTERTFDPLPCVGIGSYVYGINNRGQFVGLNFDSADPNNVWGGFIATPATSDE